MTTSTPGTPIWIDLAVTDLDRAKRFYGELFGWTFDDRGEDFGHYNIVRKDGRDIGGAMQRTPDMTDGTPDAFAVYLSTPDAQSTAERAVNAGATIVVPPMEVGEQGTMLGMVDPSGAFIGAWQPGLRTGFETGPSDIGAPGWMELMTTDYDAVIPFYTDVFGFDETPFEGIRYATNAPADQATYGICDAPFLPEGMSSFWRVYVNVADPEAAGTRIRELGGEVLEGPIDSPFGPLSTVADDQGVLFQIIGPMTDASAED